MPSGCLPRSRWPPVPAERLADQLWDGEPPTTWRVALRGLVAQLREAAGDPGFVVTGRHGHHPRRRGGHRPATACRRPRDRAAVDLLTPTVGVRGERLLPRVDAPWLAAARAELDDLGLRVAETVVAAHGRLGDHAEAVGIAQQCVTAYPLAERAHRTLLSALGAAADRSAAVLAFERCRSPLANELGVDPSDGTVPVYLEAIGGSDPTGGPSCRRPRAASSVAHANPPSSRRPSNARAS